VSEITAAAFALGLFIGALGGVVVTVLSLLHGHVTDPDFADARSFEETDTPDAWAETRVQR